jgi:predicted DsbA family dithiol-disulfide isomerase
MPLTIDLWSDPICPWCWIGKHRLEQALKQAGLEQHARWNFHAFELGPRDAAPAPVTDMLRKKYGGSAQDIRDMFKRVEDLGAELGLKFEFERSIAAPTFTAQRLVKAAAPSGRAGALLEAMHLAHFTKGLDLSDTSVLQALAVEAGLPAAETAAVLGGDAWTLEVEQDEERAAAYDISGVPFFVFQGRLALGGAQPVETFVKALEQARNIE